MFGTCSLHGSLPETLSYDEEQKNTQTCETVCHLNDWTIKKISDYIENFEFWFSST